MRFSQKAAKGADLVVPPGRLGGHHLRRGRPQRQDLLHGALLLPLGHGQVQRTAAGTVRKDHHLLRRNLLAELVPYLRRLGFDCWERRSENLLTVRLGGHENRFLLFGGRDESSAALIQGSTPGGGAAGRGGP